MQELTKYFVTWQIVKPPKSEAKGGHCQGGPGAMAIYETLESLGISLPAVTAPVAAFVPWVRAGDLLFISGHIAKQNGKPWSGQLGVSLTTEEGKQAARGVAIDLMGTLHAASGDLRRIKQIVKLMVLVNSGPGFMEHHLVANGASELFQHVFGTRGAHARSAFGVAQVPFGSCVEIDLVVQLAEDGSAA
jgi:enamine deaminase RidA (YjgF/YER057c/UK114 family)